MISAAMSLAAVLSALLPGSPSAAGDSVAPASQPTTAGVIIEIDYPAEDFGGASLTWQAPEPCSVSLADIDYEVPNVDLTIGSYRNYNGCAATHYTLPNFQGPIAPGTPGPHQVRSIRWT
jgi:hypothetical protein